MQPLAILFGAAFTVATAFSLGAILLRDSCSDPAVRFVTGASLLSILVFAACALRVAYPAVFLVIGAGAMVAARSQFRLPKRPSLTRWSLLFLPFFILYFFNSMAPEISYDGARYHLALVGRYLREHGFELITDNFYAALSQGVEMLFLFAYAFGRHSAAAMVHFTFLLALTWQLYRRSKLAAALVFASPIVGVDASSAYVDVAVAAIAFTLFQVLHVWSETRSTRLLIAAGLLAGFACAAKYTAFVAVAFALGFILWESRRLAYAVVAASCAALQVLPWLFKNYFWFQNPLAPFFNSWFPNPYVTASFENEYRAKFASLGPYYPSDLPLQITTFGSMSGLAGPVFLLAPIALLALRWSEGRRLLLAAAIFAAPYNVNVSTRFLIPAIPFVAMAMSLALARVPRAAVALVVMHAVLSWPDILKRYAKPDAWRLAKVPFREALRIKPEPGFLESNLPLYGITRRIDELTPPGSTIFTDVSLPDAYTSRNIRVSFQSAQNIVSRRVWFSGFVPEHAPVLRARFPMPLRDRDFLTLSQAGRGAASWTIHEIRAFDGGRELDRSAWRGIEPALDGRPASLWMSSDTLRPGQFVRIDFSRPQRFDTVVVEMAPDQPDARLVLSTADLQVSPQFDEIAAPPDLRRRAAEELKRRGIDYLLAFDGQFGADDLQTRQSDWGIQQITEYKGVRLYRLP